MSETTGVKFEPPVVERLILRDDAGGVWAMTVRSDGQLQTQRLPDGEPATMGDRMAKDVEQHLAERIAEIIR